MSADESFIRDDRWFEYYRVDTENLNRSGNELRSLAEKQEKKILMAVVRNDVDTLKQLLTSPKWYRVVDSQGLSLLHIAILEKNREAFDFLLSLVDFPLDLVSDEGETSLITSIISIDKNNKTRDDYFAWKLIEAGADIFCCDDCGQTTLACASLKHHVKMAEHFIQNGVDVNVPSEYGHTALHFAVIHDSPDCIECVCLLLENGADAGILNQEEEMVAFELAIQRNPNSLLHEILFYYTYDEFSEMKIHLSTLTMLARDHSPLLIHFEDVDIDSNWLNLFKLDVEYLRYFINKFKCVVAEVLPRCKLKKWSPHAVTLEKLESFIHSDLKMDLISCIQNEQDDVLFQRLIRFPFDETSINQIACYLLSYGLSLTESGLQTIYRKFGYCDLLKTLLHMDIQTEQKRLRHIMPSLFYDVTFDLDYYLENSDKFLTENVYHLLRYFVDARLNQICCDLYDEEIYSRIRNLPQVPSLVELARNCFRRHFIRTFKIRTSRQFYTLINNLNVPDVYKKIVTFEKILYKV